MCLPACVPRSFTPSRPPNRSHLPACLSEPPIYPSPATPNSTLTRPASAAWSSPFLTPPARRTGESWNVSLFSHKGSASGAEASDEGGAGAPDASGGERHTSLASAPRSFVRSMTVALHAPSSRLRGYSTPLPFPSLSPYFAPPPLPPFSLLRPSLLGMEQATTSALIPFRCVSSADGDRHLPSHRHSLPLTPSSRSHAAVAFAPFLLPTVCARDQRLSHSNSPAS